jgi:hypothetical protein
LAAGGTIREPSGEIRNVPVDGHGHDFIIQRLKGSPTFDLGQRSVVGCAPSVVFRELVLDLCGEPLWGFL